MATMLPFGNMTLRHVTVPAVIGAQNVWTSLSHVPRPFQQWTEIMGLATTEVEI